MDRKQKGQIERLIEQNPNYAKRGQGYNDSRGEIPEEAEEPTDKNIKNNLGPQQKRRRLARLGPPAVEPGYVPPHGKRNAKPND